MIIKVAIRYQGGSLVWQAGQRARDHATFRSQFLHFT